MIVVHLHLAGIYDVWEHPLTGEQHHTVAIITTAANRLTATHRTPPCTSSIVQENKKKNGLIRIYQLLRID